MDETKHASKTTEFWTYVPLALAVIIAAAVTGGFGPNELWRYLTILTVGYLLSRGLAKALRGRGRGHETKPSFKTTEFWIFLVALLALFITGLATEGEGSGELDTLDASRTWLYATILGAAYMVSRGLAKSGAGAREGGSSGGSGLGERVKAAAQAFEGSGSTQGGGGRGV